ncbi:MAG: DUF523 domain-containing protein [Mitsuokella sp.]|uniref:DUF523 domain-containing protein n=1 Tax=Mitsuokella sp. TaxID=2049034 RepID=UPI003EFE12AA
MILVSACLLGHKVKYNGGSNDHALLQKYNARGRFVAVCPECFGRLPVPRTPMEIRYGTGRKVLEDRAKIVDAEGHDLTAAMRLGAEKVLRIVETYHAETAILKDGSPSCGVHRIYNGSFTGTKIRGTGVTAALLQQHGLTVYSEEDMTPDRLEELIAEDIRRDNYRL